MTKAQKLAKKLLLKPTFDSNHIKKDKNSIKPIPIYCDSFACVCYVLLMISVNGIVLKQDV